MRATRLDRGMTQQEVGQTIGVNRSFIYEMELNQHKLTIYSLHKAFQFLGFVPNVLNINEKTIQGKLLAHRIRYGLTYIALAKVIGLDKSTIAHFKRRE